MSQASEIAEPLNSKYVLLRLDESNQNVPLEAIGIYHTEEAAYAEGLMNQMQAIEDSTKNKPKNLLQLKHDAILELCRYLKDDLTNYKARFEYLSSQCTELFSIPGVTYKVLEANSLHGQEMNESIFKTRVRNFQDAFQSQLADEEEDLEESNDEDDDDDEEEVDEEEEEEDDDEEDIGEEGDEEEEEEGDEDEEDEVDVDEGENGHPEQEEEQEDDDIDEVEELEEEEELEEDEPSEDVVPEANDCGSEGDSEYGELGQKRSRSQSQSDDGDDDEEEDEIEEDGDEDELEEEEELSTKKQRLTA